MANGIILNPGLDIEDLKSRIYIVRGQQVMLDRDLAELYGVETKRLNEAVRRNIDRFPDDFRFQLNNLEVKALMSQMVIVADLRSQIATSSGWYTLQTLCLHRARCGYAELGAALGDGHTGEH